MNIVFLYANGIDPNMGGVQRVTSVLTDYFESKHLNVYYLSLPNKNFNDFKNKSHRQHYLPYAKGITRNSLFFLDFMKRKNIDVVINQHGISPMTSEIAYTAKESNVKIISVINNSILSGIENFHSLYKSIAQKKKLSWLLPLTKFRIIKRVLLVLYKNKYKNHYRRLCDKSDVVIQLSDKFRYELEYMTDRKVIDNLISIPNPVSFDAANIDISRKKKELLYVGRLDTINKRLDLLLDIWSRLYNKFPDWKLKIVGDGPGLDALVSMTKKMDLKRVSFEGFQNPISYYIDASIFCMTSAAESFGIVLLEAMQYGVVPFAFLSYPSVSDIIDHRKNGILISAFNCEEYKKELSILMNDVILREKMAIAATVKSETFSIEKIGNTWLDLLRVQTRNKH
ncbi:MAG: glycosyltransferase [Bacteroidetes bacterium]|nr:glycosyltransferase [Bacteroidota bacterium]